MKILRDFRSFKEFEHEVSENYNTSLTQEKYQI